MDEFVKQGKEKTFKYPGVILKRQFGALLEKVLSEEYFYVKIKKRTSLVLQGIRLKAPINKPLIA